MIAGDLEKRIVEYHALLNSKDLVESKWYRRNTIHYELLSYVNHIVALYISARFDAIPTFLHRASSFLKSERGEHITGRYRDTVEAYLTAMAQFVRAQPNLSDGSRSLIEESEGDGR